MKDFVTVFNVSVSNTEYPDGAAEYRSDGAGLKEFVEAYGAF